MVSRFESRFKKFAVPKLAREFDTEIVFVRDSGDELQFLGWVDIEELPSGGEGFVDVNGKVIVQTSKLIAEVEELGSLKQCRFRDELFDVYSHSPDQYGTTAFNIRRKFDEQQHSNLYDLHGKQIPYAD